MLDLNLLGRLLLGVGPAKPILGGEILHGHCFLLPLLLRLTGPHEGDAVLAGGGSFALPGGQGKRAVGSRTTNRKDGVHVRTLGMEGDDHALRRLVLVHHLAANGIEWNATGTGYTA